MKKYALYYIPASDVDFAKKANSPNFSSAKAARDARDGWNFRTGKETVALYVSEDGKFPELLPKGSRLWRSAQFRPIGQRRTVH